MPYGMMQAGPSLRTAKPLMIGTGDIGSHFSRLCKAVGMKPSVAS